MALAAAGLALAGSVDGRPIAAEAHGERGAARDVLVVGSIHGDETEGERVVERLAKPRSVARLGDGVRLWLVESLNPDGVAAATRGNAHGVDLNRNFPWNWEEIPESSGYYSGPRPASEPETKGMVRFLRRVDPDVTIYYHQPFGRTLIPCDRRGRRVALEYAELSGLPPDDCFPSPPGSATGFQGHRLKQRAFVVEFAAGELGRAEVRRHTRAVLEIANPGDR